MNALRTLTPYFRPYRWHMALVVLSALAVTAMSLVSPWIVRELIQLITADNLAAGQTRITQLASALLVAFIIRSLGKYLQSYVAHIVAWNFVSDMQGVVYQHLQKLSLRFYASRQTGEIISRVTGDTQDLEPLLAHTIPDGIVYSLMFVGVSTALLILNPWLTLLILLPMPVLFWLVRRFADGEREGFDRALRNLGAFRAQVQDNLSGIKEIQIFAQEAREGQRVAGMAKAATDERIYALKMQARIPAAVELAAGIGTVVIVWLGGRWALDGLMPVENLVAFVLYLSLLYEPVRVLAYMNEGLQMGMAGAERVIELLQLESEITDPEDAVEMDHIEGQVTIENVSFSYLSEVPILEDISVTVEPGQVLALVGPTGAGKSTLTALVARFYDPERGRTMIDGVDVRQMRLATLRQNISMVLQDVFLFNGSVRDNIRFGMPEASDEAVETAARVACAHDFIVELPDGYDTQIGERGVRLSGGQKQRLAIARAVLKDAPILILDEATSAVDTQTEAEIQEAMNRLMKGRTSIVVAHRLSTVRNADIIAVMEHGRIVERGRHEDLIRQNGLYRQLYERHLQDEPVSRFV